MNPLVSLLRCAANLKLRLLRHAIIQDIPTARFNALIQSLLSSGWSKTYEYTGFDAWIDYGRVDLKKGRARLRLSWDNWCEGEVRGPQAAVAAIAQQVGVPVSRSIKWHFVASRGNGA